MRAAEGVALAAATILLAFGRGDAHSPLYGRRCVPVEVDQPMIDGLVRQGFLKSGARRDNAAIGAALSTKLRVQRQYGGGP